MKANEIKTILGEEIDIYNDIIIEIYQSDGHKADLLYGISSRPLNINYLHVVDKLFKLGWGNSHEGNLPQMFTLSAYGIIVAKKGIREYLKELENDESSDKLSKSLSLQLNATQLKLLNKQLKDYPITKGIAWAALIISMLALAFEFYKWVKS